MRVGAPGTSWNVAVDERGVARLGDLTLECWVGADDRWHLPTDAAGLRHDRPGVAPTTETRVRVPGGDAVQRLWAVPDEGGAVVVEVENDSPVPFVVAFVVRAEARHGSCSLDVCDDVVLVDDQPALRLPRQPARWATAAGATQSEVLGGAARDGGVAPVSGRSVEGAFLFPVPHRTVIRAAFGPDVRADPKQVSSNADVERGWEQLLERGMRVEFPEPLQAEIQQARADLLLEPPSAAAFAALEAWGFDREAHAMWSHLSLRERSRARRRRVEPSSLLEMYDALVRVDGDRVELLPGFRPQWLGQSLAVHDVPMPRGTLSFAVRWHGARPALLWDAPEEYVLTAPALDPSWSGAGGAGETLLAEPPAPLLAMGTVDRRGDAVDAPESFS